MSENSSLPARISEWRILVPGIADQLKHILITGEMSDVQFAVGRQYGDTKIIHAHKFVLSLGSDVFHTMFNGGLPETGDTPIDIPEILPEAFANMLRYLYTGSVDGELKAENVFETIYCADKYNLPPLMELCLEFTNTQLTADNCLMFLDKVGSVKSCIFPPLMHRGFCGKCLAVVDEDCKNVVQSLQFSLIRRDILEMILKRSTLHADENTIYTAVEKWSVEACVRDGLEPSPTNRRCVLGPALFLVRFPLMTDPQLATGPVKSGLLLDSKLRDIYQFHHSDTKPRLCFPTKFRLGSMVSIFSGHTEYIYKEQVFVDVDSPGACCWPAKIIGKHGTDALVALNDGVTIQQCAPSRIARAVDVLKKASKAYGNSPRVV
ncbi:BTB/POZ domain-containing protein 3-like [Paramacrobiotus metropolitanus]|uniref:BTB/POZ domain-containing protein 3-like n=1 Tax=Paramacrobiotus metropolitanus TaxID=2943436 RepID=UPI002445DDDF|nr:BTB/POZ domain-containing protein 3-like [Paramacrobiotus metropolitanus]